jgi:Enzyme involved in the deoxyxylulose pathway of isoprenoid biosynthesis
MSNWIKRKKTKVVKVGNVSVGGHNPISIQSMTNTDTCDEVSTTNPN